MNSSTLLDAFSSIARNGGPTFVGKRSMATSTILPAYLPRVVRTRLHSPLSLPPSTSGVFSSSSAPFSSSWTDGDYDYLLDNLPSSKAVHEADPSIQLNNPIPPEKSYRSIVADDFRLDPARDLPGKTYYKSFIAPSRMIKHKISVEELGNRLAEHGIYMEKLAAQYSSGRKALARIEAYKQVRAMLYPDSEERKAQQEATDFPWRKATLRDVLHEATMLTKAASVPELAIKLHLLEHGAEYPHYQPFKKRGSRKNIRLTQVVSELKIRNQEPPDGDLEKGKYKLRGLARLESEEFSRQLLRDVLVQRGLDAEGEEKELKDRIVSSVLRLEAYKNNPFGE